MSFSDAIAQVDQIFQWEQQLTDPAALTQTTGSGGVATTGDTGSSTGTDATTNPSFAQQLASAQAQDGSEAVSTTDPTTDLTTDPTAATTTGTSDLLNGGDSQLLTALSSLNGSGGSTGATDPTGELSSLESALAASGYGTATTGTSAVNSDSGAVGGMAASASDPRIQAMTEEANALVGKPYVWGGGHDGWGPQSGYDCSGFVSAVLHAGGYLSTPQDTTTLPTASGIESGPGQYVTIYDRDQPGQSGHVIINIDGQFYESGGQQGSWGGGGGVQEISTPSASYLATFDQVLHPTGL